MSYGLCIHHIYILFSDELSKNVVSTVRKWKKLLKYYLPSIDEEVKKLPLSLKQVNYFLCLVLMNILTWICQIEVILKFEEMCLESSREYSPLFVQVCCFVLEVASVLQSIIRGLNYSFQFFGC